MRLSTPAFVYLSILLLSIIVSCTFHLLWRFRHFYRPRQRFRFFGRLPRHVRRAIERRPDDPISPWPPKER